MTLRTNTAGIITLISLLLISCGPKKPLITQQQISDARANGSLEQLYSKVVKDESEASGKAQRSLQALSLQISEQIALDRQQKIYQSLEDSRLPSGVASISVIEELKKSAKAIETFSPTYFNQTSAKLTRESGRSQSALSQQLIVVSKIPVSDQLRRINAMSTAASIAGENSEHYLRYSQQREQAIFEWMTEADAALAARKYPLAATFLRKVLGLDPNNQDAKGKLAQSEKQGFETNFRQALENSKPILAYNELLRIAESPLFSGVKDGLSSSIQLLNTFFINRALQASSQGLLKKAYQNFVKARNIQRIMEQPFQKDAEHDYLQKLMNLAAGRGNVQKWGEQLAYLEVVREFNSEFTGLAAALVRAHKSAIDYSATRLYINDFAQTGTSHSAGKSVATKTFNWVYENLAGDVQLLTDGGAATVHSGPGRLILLEGDILQAGVDSDSNPGQKTMRVVTKTTKTPNPVYAEWVDDGKKGTAPEEFNISHKTEDVTININYQRKTGILSTGYRLIDRSTGDVMVNDSVREKLLFEGESNQGVNIGEFKLPFKRAELLSDIEIMEQLSIKAAEKLGAKLNSLFSGADKRYEALGDKALERSQVAEAVNFYAYAVAIGMAKKADVSDLRNKLIESTMR